MQGRCHQEGFCLMLMCRFFIQPQSLGVMKRVEKSDFFFKGEAPLDTQGWRLPWNCPQPQRMVLEEHMAILEGEIWGKAPHYVWLCQGLEKL